MNVKKAQESMQTEYRKEITMVKEGISDDEARDELEKRSKKVTEEDLGKVLKNRSKIEQLVAGHGPLKRFVDDIRILISMVKDYYSGAYREIPWWAISAVVAALLYVLSPIDLIPDVIPVIGFIDDAAVVGVCLALIEHQLMNYQAWKNS